MTNKNISLNVTDLGIEKECSICFEQLLTDVVCCQECSKWIHKNCWRRTECPFCRNVKGWRKLNNIERTIKNQLKFECEGCEVELDHEKMLVHIKICSKVEVLCECNKLITREQLKDHLEVCSQVETVKDPEIEYLEPSAPLELPTLPTPPEPSAPPEYESSALPESFHSNSERIWIQEVISMGFTSLRVEQMLKEKRRLEERYYPYPIPSSEKYNYQIYRYHFPGQKRQRFKPRSTPTPDEDFSSFIIHNIFPARKPRKSLKKRFIKKLLKS